MPPILAPMSLGHVYDQPTNSYPVAGPAGNGLASYPYMFTTQIANGNFITVPPYGASIGNNQVGTTGGANLLPLGGFVHNGDVLQVPFIGAYRIYDPAAGAAGFWEMNSLPMDAAMAEDTSWDDDLAAGADETGADIEYAEQLGRFVPPPIENATGMTAYQWAADVLDHFTALQNPHDDFMPNIDPSRYPVPPGSPSPRTVGVSSNGNTSANSEGDRDTPIDGLVNVNTASWKALSALPLVVNPTDGRVIIDQTEALAKAIVRFRDEQGAAGAGSPPHGPFKNLFELNQVVDWNAPTQGFRNMYGQLTIGTDPDDFAGDFSPVGTGPAFVDGVRHDFEERNANLIRLSNLLTTRSDTFTVYVLVQGWKQAGTPFPSLVVERRSAFIVDRSKLNSDTGSIAITPVPTR
jgi:hypothetical protein